MIIYPDTKIAYVIKQNKQSIEAIAALAKPLEKLRNPLLRKMLAGRTTLADAARMGGCDLDALGAALKPLGFEWVNELEKQQKGKGALTASGAFQGSLDELPQTVLDVRSDLASGQDPLKKIMAAVSALPQGHVLRLINSFEPTPLISLLAAKGYAHLVKREGPDEVHAFFTKPSDVPAPDGEPSEVPELTETILFEAKLKAFGVQVTEVDVRGMEMPQPMVTILEALQALPDQRALLVTHQRIPVFLFAELKERSFAFLVNKRGDTDVRLLIFRKEK